MQEPRGNRGGRKTTSSKWEADRENGSGFRLQASNHGVVMARPHQIDSQTRCGHFVTGNSLWRRRARSAVGPPTLAKSGGRRTLRTIEIPVLMREAPRTA